MTLESRLRACCESRPAGETGVADVLLHHPGRLATHSATELAAAAGVSKAAVTRLIQRLGYASYADARSEARDAQQWGSPLYLDAGALATARRVVAMGFRSSAWLAMYARSQFGLLRQAVELAPLPAETLAEGLCGLGPQDMLLAIGFRRRVPAFATALRAARAARTRIALVSDPSGAAEQRLADWPLTVHCRGAAMFDSCVAGVSLLNFLATQLAAALGGPALRRLQGVEQWRRQLEDLA